MAQQQYCKSTLTFHLSCRCVSFSNDGDSLAVGCKDGGVTIWRIDQEALSEALQGNHHTVIVSRQRVLDFPGGNGLRSVECLGFALSGEALVCGMGSGQEPMIVWDLMVDKSEGFVAMGHTNWVVSISVSRCVLRVCARRSDVCGSC